MAAVSTASRPKEEASQRAENEGVIFLRGLCRSPLGPNTTTRGCEIAAWHLSLSGSPRSCFARARREGRARGTLSKQLWCWERGSLEHRAAPAQPGLNPGNSLAGQECPCFCPGITRLGSLARGWLDGQGGLLTQPHGTRAPCPDSASSGSRKVFLLPIQHGGTSFHNQTQTPQLFPPTRRSVKGEDTGRREVGMARVPPPRPRAPTPLWAHVLINAE